MRQPIEESQPEAALTRPLIDRSVSDRAREWIEWFGVARLTTSAVAVVVVCVGGWWLVRTPPAPPESALPVAGTDVAAGAATLPPPVAVSTVESVPANPPPAAVVVHVAGAVRVPGVFEFSAGRRVADAIDRAGGPAEDAHMAALNLAAPLVDGTQIYVPVVGEEVPTPASLPGSEAAPGTDAPIGPIDVNRAIASELETLPGVGPATAAAIITERDRNGPFVSLADLERVPGIGPAKLAALEGLVAT